MADDPSIDVTMTPQPMPDVSAGAAPTPAYTGGSGDPTADMLQQDNFQPSSASGGAPPPPQQGLWQRILQGALSGLAGAKGAKSFGAGAAGGAAGYLEQQQQQVENQQKQQQLSQQEQRNMDAHDLAQAQLATAHITQLDLTRQYNISPKNTQDIMDQASMKAGEAAMETGGKKLGHYETMAEAQANLGAFQKGNPDSALSAQIYRDPTAGFNLISVANPDKLNDKPVEVTIGYDTAKNQPITKTYPAGTISFATRQNMETTATQNATQASNQLELHRKTSAIDTAAAGQKAYLEQRGKNRADAETLGSRTDAFGDTIGVTPEGQPLPPKEFLSRQDKFSKDYVQPLGVLQKTTAEFDRINNNPNQTGAERVTALLNAVGISGDPLKGKGFRISNDIINEHAQARNVWQGAVQKLNTIFGSGGPITPQQIKDYTNVAQGVVHDAYVTAAQEAKRQALPKNFLPKATKQGQAPSLLVTQIYVDAAQGNKDAATKAMQAAGYR